MIEKCLARPRVGITAQDFFFNLQEEWAFINAKSSLTPCNRNSNFCLKHITNPENQTMGSFRWFKFQPCVFTQLGWVLFFPWNFTVTFVTQYLDFQGNRLPHVRNWSLLSKMGKKVGEKNILGGKNIGDEKSWQRQQQWDSLVNIE